MKFNTNGYLEPGLHEHTTEEIEEHLVKGFPTSTTRGRIMNGYKQHKSELEDFGFDVEQFIDGSFASTKNDPSDIDMVCFADADKVDALSEQDKQKFYSLVNGPITKTSHLCDAYFCPIVPENDPRFPDARQSRKYWIGEFGYDRQDNPKGIVKTNIPTKTGGSE